MKPKFARFPRWLRPALLLPLLFAGGAAMAEVHDLALDPCVKVETTFATKVNEPVNVAQPGGATIKVTGAKGDVYWDFASGACTGTGLVRTCAGMTVNLPVPNADTPAPGTSTVTITGAGASTPQEAAFTLTVTDVAPPYASCNGTYTLHVTGAGGGWGDPHLTTVDGVHYDFQSAGEFTALRGRDFELQTRQTPVPSATVPISDPYTGLRSCVSIYTAVAARIGSNRVTIQQDPAGGDRPVLLRLNGAPVTLDRRGITLSAREGGLVRGGRFEGRIDTISGNGIQITDARGAQVVVKPDYWGAQQLWYLNVNVANTTSSMGTMGAIAAHSWLPALPDGSSLGPKPTSEQQRYNDLYGKFADAWRVTDATSLFDYAPGTNTATFKRADWPRNNPQACDIPGQVPVQPVAAAVAQQACSGVSDPVKKRDCVFDVSVTGDTGFAQGYGAMEQLKPAPSGWVASPAQEGALGSSPGKHWPWWIAILLALLALVGL